MSFARKKRCIEIEKAKIKDCQMYPISCKYTSSMSLTYCTVFACSRENKKSRYILRLTYLIWNRVAPVSSVIVVAPGDVVGGVAPRDHLHLEVRRLQRGLGRHQPAPAQPRLRGLLRSLALRYLQESNFSLFSNLVPNFNTFRLTQTGSLAYPLLTTVSTWSQVLTRSGAQMVAGE